MIIDSGTIGMQSTRTYRSITKVSARYFCGQGGRTEFAF